MPIWVKLEVAGAEMAKFLERKFVGMSLALEQVRSPFWGISWNVDAREAREKRRVLVRLASLTQIGELARRLVCSRDFLSLYNG